MTDQQVPSNNTPASASYNFPPNSNTQTSGAPPNTGNPQQWMTPPPGNYPPYHPHGYPYPNFSHAQGPAQNIPPGPQLNTPTSGAPPNTGNPGATRLNAQNVPPEPQLNTQTSGEPQNTGAPQNTGNPGTPQQWMTPPPGNYPPYHPHGYPPYPYPHYPPGNYPPGNYPPGNYPPGNYPPGNYPPGNYPPYHPHGYPPYPYPAYGGHPGSDPNSGGSGGGGGGGGGGNPGSYPPHPYPSHPYPPTPNYSPTPAPAPVPVKKKVCKYVEDECLFLQEKDAEHASEYTHKKSCPFGTPCQLRVDEDHDAKYVHLPLPTPAPVSAPTPASPAPAPAPAPAPTKECPQGKQCKVFLDVSLGEARDKHLKNCAHNLPGPSSISNTGNTGTHQSKKRCPLESQCPDKNSHIHCQFFDHPPDNNPTPQIYHATGSYSGGYTGGNNSGRNNSGGLPYPAASSLTPVPGLVPLKPLCPRATDCPFTNNISHKEEFWHYCRSITNKTQCKFATDKDHIRRFLHTLQN